MKKSLTLVSAFVALALSAVTLYADGPSTPRVDPPVTVPIIPSSPLDGLYFGVMATKTETTSQSETSTTECVFPDDEYESDYKKKTVYTPPQCEDVTTTTLSSLFDEETKASAFAGYRFSMGQSVLGIEVGSDGELSTVEAQAGLALTPNLLSYAFGGGADLDGERGTSYGLGVDYVSDSGWLVGARAMQADFDFGEVKQVGLRIGYSF